MVNISDFEVLISKLTQWRDLFKITTKRDKNTFKIILREKVPTSSRKYNRRIIISLSLKMQSYSIASFEIHKNKDNKEHYVPLFSMKINGDRNINNISSELKAIITGADKRYFGSKPSFNLKV